MQENTADAQITVIASRPWVTLGDSFAYIVTVKNTGTIPFARCILSSQLPPALCVVKLEVEGTLVQGDYTSGIELKNLDCSQSLVLIVTVKTANAFPVDVYHNLVKGSFETIADEAGQPVCFTKSAQDKEGLNMILPKLTLLMSVDYPDSAVGETVVSTIVVKNDGNTPLNQIMVVNTLPPQLKFLIGSVLIDGVRQTCESIIKGITICTLAVSEIRTLCFEAEIVGRTQGELIHQAKGTFAYSDTAQAQEKCGNTYSNPIALHLYAPRLSLTKTVDQPLAILGDSMRYMVKLTNDGDIPAEDVLFIDRLPTSLELIDGSFSVNQQEMYSVNLQDGIYLDAIAPGSTKTITYRTKVISADCGGKIKNEALAEFAYGMQQSRHKRMCSELSMVESPVAISLFQQVNLQQSFFLQEKKPEIKQINHIGCTSEMTQCYVIETARGASLEGQQLTGSKLIVHGTLELSIEYTANKDGESIHFMTYRLPFSTFMILPPDCKPSFKREVNVSLEGIYYHTCSPKEFLVYGILLVTCSMQKQDFCMR